MESLVFLVIMFLVGGLLQSLGQKNKERRRHLPEPGPADDAEPSAEGPKDILQAIREAMEQAERRRQIESAAPREVPPARPKAIPPRRPALPPKRMPTKPSASSPRRAAEPPAEDLFEEEGQSLETEPQVTSLEVPEIRRERAVVDRDDEIEDVVRQRARWAEDHARPISPADHRAFDQRIRPPAASRSAQSAGPPSPPRFDLRSIPAARLRELIVWQEVLGKPRSLRDDY